MAVNGRQAAVAKGISMSGPARNGAAISRIRAEVIAQAAQLLDVSASHLFLLCVGSKVNL